ncbi:F-box/WD repeat-containing protein pof10 [Hypsizygus marmoreus]|uniref:F-box/WD repeat-containing protein pof10 n=1 Tax=Hypsizygus marmoreus TaxID=39966 RepID=A0A369J6K6_HYPMA|nr:F-box/WD repeat-containing protein pof10 [Hypsizygus marmoreus]
MLNRPTLSPRESSYIKSTKFNQNQAYQHGKPDYRILLGVPSETLTGITSYLDPPSLLSLARVHGRLNEHVKNDNTWHRAFVCQFFGIAPESEINDSTKSLMLRRSETTWKNEFMLRYRLRRRWERSRNVTVAHIPLDSEISSMHLMAGHFLLSSSIRYGVVSRSFPLTGKILPGYLDASGARMGLGIGNPNAEFSPNVSACALTSDGGTAKVLWGFRHGEVAIMTAPRTMDGSRRPVTDLVRCNVNEEHEGTVLDAVWDSAGAVVGTGSADGRVKMWDAKTVQCLWTSTRKAGTLDPDPCVKVAISMAQGLIATVTSSGEIIIWTGVTTLGAFSSTPINEIRVPSPKSPAGDDANANTTPEVSCLYIDQYAPSPTILVSYKDDPYFYRLRITCPKHVETTVFGDASFGLTSTLSPYFSPTNSFILVGDHIGCISVYDWNSPTPPPRLQSVGCVRKFEAHEDGASVTALTWNGVTLITGSARGTTHVWDALTFEHLRSFPSPLPRVRHRGAHVGAPERENVHQIVVGPEKEVLIVCVGNRVLAWKAGPVPKMGAGGVRGRHALGAGTPGKKNKERNGVAKYLQQVELHQTISESKDLLKQEAEYNKKAYGREREHWKRLQSMGLDETEAVEYVLMLSRDEALQRQRHVESQGQSSSTGGGYEEEGVFEGDFEEEIIMHSDPFTASASSNSLSTPSASGASTPRSGFTIPRVSRSTSNQKVQVSPRLIPEPMEAGFEPTALAPSTSSSVSSDETHFPHISASSSPSPQTAIMMSRTHSSGSNSDHSLSGKTQAGLSSGSLSGSPRSIRSTSAWRTPLSISRPVSNSSGSSAASSSVGARPYSHLGLDGADALDEELRFAIELSLAEARSRGDNV